MTKAPTPVGGETGPDRISVARDFTMLPGPRYKRQGPSSAEEFRDRMLAPLVRDAMRKGRKVSIDLDGTRYGYPVGWLEETFGGLARKLGANAALETLEITGQDAEAAWAREEALRFIHTVGREQARDSDALPMNDESDRTPLGKRLRQVQKWRNAEAWLDEGRKPRGLPHATDENRTRWVDMNGEKFTKDDILWLRSAAVLDCVGVVEGRTCWRPWPDRCKRREGPFPPRRVDEVRVELKMPKDETTKQYFVYCTVASAGKPLSIGSVELRTFAEDDDPTPPTDAGVVIRTSSEEDDDLSWVADLAVLERLPE